MEFRVLGPLEVLDGERRLAVPAGHQRTLLLLLLVHANRVLTVDRIVDVLWGGELPATGSKALAYHVSQLRDALAPGRRGADRSVLATEAGGYVLRVEPGSIDAGQFETLVRRGHEELRDDPTTARATLVEALALWRGEPLVDAAYAEFAQAEIRRLEELRLGALEDRLDADLALGRHAAVVAELEALVAANPLRERPRGLLVLALYRAGRQAEALRVAGDGRRLLAEELGIDPSPELARLEAWVLAQDARLDGPPVPLDPEHRARNPYKGLRPFGEADSADFFGREALVRHLVARLDEVLHAGRLLVVVGPSRSGKSSVVRAGLVPALRAGALDGSERWRIATMVPGVDPFRELAAALRAAGGRVPAAAVDAAEQEADLAPILGPALADGAPRVLLLIDQLEELWVRVDEAARGRFLAALVASVGVVDSPLVALTTLRADFFDRPLRSPGLGDLMPRGVEIVTPLTREELERAISRPAEAVGVAVEAGLVAEVVADVERRPATLPLLQYALTDLFDRSDGRRLTREGYAAIGGATAALGRAADEAWTSLEGDAREVARQVLLRFAVLSESAGTTARRTSLAELRSLGDGVDTILDELGRRRLVTFDRDPVNAEPTVEVAHEALLTHWPRLAGWIDGQRQDLRVRGRVDGAAAEWERAGRLTDYLANGARLDEFAAWAAGTSLALTDAERAFIEESLAQRRRLHLRGRRIRLGVAGALVAVAVVVGSLAALLVGERQAAAEREDITAARGLASGAIASLGKDPELSLLLALQAANATVARGYVVEEAYDALHWALQEAQVAYPRDVGRAAVRQGPDGPRGEFLLPPDELMRTAAAYVRRSLFPEECRTYLHEAACQSVIAPAAGGPELGVRTSSGVVPAASLAVPSAAGTQVRVLSELPADLAPLLAGFEAASGVGLAWETPTGGLATALTTGDLPDVAIVERASLVAAAGRAGSLLDVDGLVDTAALRADAGPYLLGLGTGSDGERSHLFGAPLAVTLDDLLWYPADAFSRAGYSPPATRAELTALVSRIQHDGRAPWCLGTQPDGSTTPQTDAGPATLAWVEDLLLDTAGPAAYDRWVTGRDSFFREGADRPGGTPSAVQAAIERFRSIVAEPGAVYAGLEGAAWTAETAAALPMVVDDGPRCWLFRGSSTDRRTFAGRPGSFSAVPFPGSDRGPHPALGRLYQVVVLHDRPEVRALVAVLLDRPLAAAVTSRLAAEGMLPVRTVAPPVDSLETGQLARLRSSIGDGTFRVRAVDQLPDAVVASFRQTVAAYLADIKPVLLARLWEIDSVWEELRRDAAP